MKGGMAAVIPHLWKCGILSSNLMKEQYIEIKAVIQGEETDQEIKDAIKAFFKDHGWGNPEIKIKTVRKPKDEVRNAVIRWVKINGVEIATLPCKADIQKKILYTEPDKRLEFPRTVADIIKKAKETDTLRCVVWVDGIGTLSCYNKNFYLTIRDSDFRYDPSKKAVLCTKEGCEIPCRADMETGKIFVDTENIPYRPKDETIRIIETGEIFPVAEDILAFSNRRFEQVERDRV